MQANPILGSTPLVAPNSGGRARSIGRLSELHPSLLDAGRAAVLDLDLALLQELKPDRSAYKPVRRFPTSAFDLSVIADARELAGNLELRVRQFAGELAESIEYVREFEGAPFRKAARASRSGLLPARLTALVLHRKLPRFTTASSPD